MEPSDEKRIEGLLATLRHESAWCGKGFPLGPKGVAAILDEAVAVIELLHAPSRERRALSESFVSGDYGNMYDLLNDVDVLNSMLSDTFGRSG